MAFFGCENLKEIYLPEGVREIGCRAFAFCPNLQSIRLPSTLHCIGTLVCFDCARLKRVILPVRMGHINLRLVFADERRHITFIVPRESPAEELCIKQKLNYKAVEWGSENG